MAAERQAGGRVHACRDKGDAHLGWPAQFQLDMGTSFTFKRAIAAMAILADAGITSGLLRNPDAGGDRKLENTNSHLLAAGLKVSEFMTLYEGLQHLCGRFGTGAKGHGAAGVKKPKAFVTPGTRDPGSSRVRTADWLVVEVKKAFHKEIKNNTQLDCVPDLTERVDKLIAIRGLGRVASACKLPQDMEALREHIIKKVLFHAQAKQRKSVRPGDRDCKRKREDNAAAEGTVSESSKGEEVEEEEEEGVKWEKGDEIDGYGDHTDHMAYLRSQDYKLNEECVFVVGGLSGDKGKPHIFGHAVQLTSLPSELTGTVDILVCAKAAAPKKGDPTKRVRLPATIYQPCGAIMHEFKGLQVWQRLKWPASGIVYRMNNQTAKEWGKKQGCMEAQVAAALALVLSEKQKEGVSEGGSEDGEGEAGGEGQAEA